MSAPTRNESDTLGNVAIAADRLWGAQTQRSLQYFSIGTELMPREMVQAYAWLKKACAEANRRAGRLDGRQAALIAYVCDEILAGQHQDMFPLHVWMTGSGTQFNMNVNEVIANRCCQLAGTPLGSKTPVDPNDDVNMSQSTNDNFPSAMHVATGVGVTRRLVPAVTALRDAMAAKSALWADIIRIGRTHMQDATPLTLGQQWSGYVAMLEGNLAELDQALSDVWPLTLGGTAVGTGLNAPADFADVAIAALAGMVAAPVSSVYPGMGNQVLDYFHRNADRYNLIFAPHVMLFRKTLHYSLEYNVLKRRPDIDPKYRDAPNILVDLSGPNLFDMSYTMAADAYIGDVSSQVYEFLLHRGACYFLDPLGAPADGPAQRYEFWHNGEVLHDPAELAARIPQWRDNAVSHLAQQDRLFAQTMDYQPGKTAKQRCEALIGIAHPNFRAELRETAKKMKLL